MRDMGITHGASAGVPRKKKDPPRRIAGILLRIFGPRADEVAAKLSDDTIRRLKYPVLESMTPDGKREFEHDLGISNRARSTSG